MDYQIIDYDVNDICLKYQVSELVAKTFVYNGLNDRQIRQVLDDRSEYHENDDINLKKAVDRILEAKAKKQKVFVAGDYDCDGICATAIMKNTLDILKIENGYYIPDRFKDGYGLNCNIVSMVAGKGYDLIITVDNGIKAYEALELASKLNIDVIVSDHHIIEKELDNIVVHPQLMSEDFKGLCGAGVALQMSLKLIGENDLHDCLAMIATIGDVMELFNENRIIVKRGLKKIYQFNSLLNLVGKTNNISEEDIAFSVVPKLNSIARLDDDSNPNVLVKYLLCKDLMVINKLSKQIDELNNKRKNLSKLMYDKAIGLVNDDAFIIIEDDDFNEGLVGLVAGRIAKECKRPCIIFVKKEGLLKGSGRSVKGFDMHSFLSDFDLVSFGGHAQAVGLAINVEDFESFKLQIKNKMADIRIDEIYDEAIAIKTKDLTLDNLNQFEKLHPFGQGFNKPLFMIKDMIIDKYQILKDKYIKFELESKIQAISFNTSHKGITSPKCIVGQIGINEFRSIKNVSIQIKDME